MKRTLPLLKLNNSPLVLVLCQMRFSPILAMADYFPKIQDKLRLNGFPKVQQKVVQENIFAPGGVTSAKKTIWNIKNKDSTSSIVVADSFVAYETTAYTVFEDFLDGLVLAADTVATVVKELFVERVGLRYIDLVRPMENEQWTYYLQPGLRGIQNSMFADGTQTQLHQSIAKTQHGTMIVRFFQNREGQIFSPDLVDNDLELKGFRPVSQGELLTIVDMDHYSIHQTDYETKWLKNETWLLHDGLDHVFRESLVTPEALKTWA